MSMLFGGRQYPGLSMFNPGRIIRGVNNTFRGATTPSVLGTNPVTSGQLGKGMGNGLGDFASVGASNLGDMASGTQQQSPAAVPNAVDTAPQDFHTGSTDPTAMNPMTALDPTLQSRTPTETNAPVASPQTPDQATIPQTQPFAPKIATTPAIKQPEFQAPSPDFSQSLPQEWLDALMQAYYPDTNSSIGGDGGPGGE